MTAGLLEDESVQPIGGQLGASVRASTCEDEASEAEDVGRTGQPGGAFSVT
jgi:hypothetical protein